MLMADIFNPLNQPAGDTAADTTAPLFTSPNLNAPSQNSQQHTQLSQEIHSASNQKDLSNDSAGDDKSAENK